jgi:hypothetical protein
MPELPDIEGYGWYLDAAALHQRIEKIHMAGPELHADNTLQGSHNLFGGIGVGL